MLAVWVGACVEHARAATEDRRTGQVDKTKDGNAINKPFLGIVNRQAFIMIRTAGELSFTTSARASLAMIEESGRGGPRLIDEVNPSMNFVSVVGGSKSDAEARSAVRKPTLEPCGEYRQLSLPYRRQVQYCLIKS